HLHEGAHLGLSLRLSAARETRVASGDTLALSHVIGRIRTTSQSSRESSRQTRKDGMPFATRLRMRATTLPTMKQCLIGAGRRGPPMLLAKMNAGLNYLETGRWFASHGFSTSNGVRDRRELFARAADEISDLRVEYLEFGVWRGDSIREW